MENLRKETKSQDLNFKGGNPGAVQYGNFINYYKFHPPDNRLKLLPTDIWPKHKHFYALDIGSNSGDLTVALYHFLSEQGCIPNILGIDIDPILVERSKEKAEKIGNITFCCLDFMDEKSRFKIKDYLDKNNLKKFDSVFCFSVTMWIHLNYGDEGLKNFLNQVSNLGELIIIEPQPWKCYKSAVKRMKQSNAEFPLFKNLKIKQSVEEEIKNHLIMKCHTIQIFESNESEWNRKLLIFKHLTNI